MEVTFKFGRITDKGVEVASEKSFTIGEDKQEDPKPQPESEATE